MFTLSAFRFSPFFVFRMREAEYNLVFIRIELA